MGEKSGAADGLKQGFPFEGCVASRGSALDFYAGIYEELERAYLNVYHVGA